MNVLICSGCNLQIPILNTGCMMSNDIYDILTEMNKQDKLTGENIIFLEQCVTAKD